MRALCAPKGTVSRLSFVAGLALAGCVRAAAPVASPPATAPVAIPPSAPAETAAIVSEFGGLAQRLSESGGFFPSGNVVSNETSYLHVLDALRRVRVSGGAYIGVGPDQNYSYMAAVRPSIAFIFDIRRDNAMEHLLFKAVFSMASNRLEYLCLVTGRQCPADLEAWTYRPIRDLVDFIDAAIPALEYVAWTQREIDRRIRSFGFPMTPRDSAIVVLYRSAFVSHGLDVRYTSLDGRAPPNVPTWRALLLATDRSGAQRNYLASDSAFRFVKRMHERDLIVPVTGDVAGAHALAAIGAALRSRGETVSAFYISNVEQYVYRDGGFERFIENLRQLPRAGNAVIIRSLFGQTASVHPLAVPGNNSTSMLQYASALLREWDAGRIRSYNDVVFRAFIE